jgi:TRAP-type C4-dicarboxylate transport system permease small subunit
MKTIESVLRALVVVLRWLCMSLVIGLAVLVFFKVFFRYVLNNPIVWSDEAIMLMLLSLTYLGAALAAHRRSHISVELLETVLAKKKPTAVRTIRLISDVLTMAILSVITVFGVKLSLFSSDQETDILLLSYFWVYIILPIGLIFIMLMMFKRILDQRTSQET